VIPVYNAAGLAPTRVASLPDKGSDLPKLRLAEGAKPAAKPDSAKADAKDRIRPGQSAKTAAVKPEAKAAAARLSDPKPQKAAAKVEPAKVEAKPAKPVQVAKAEVAPVKVERAASIAPAPASPAPEVTQTASLPAAPAPKASLGYRWPARGRVISGFGGNGNEGINIALPEGTPVKAAEDGTVAYAGSEVKGYGKLVLIRHDNGHVSAYAHNGDIGVKPGEKVKRGQTIARSGQTGNVTSPQLHFEIRKGSTPIDPMPHLDRS